MSLLDDVLARALKGIPASVEEGVKLNNECSTNELCRAAHAVRLSRCGSDIDTCCIVNGRSNMCSEDCKWCSQSRFHATSAETYPIVPESVSTATAVRNHRLGVRRFSIVTSGRRVTGPQLDEFCALMRKAGEATGGMYLCASMGLLGLDEMKKLRQAGVKRYHCNLETASDLFPSLCSTHSHADKLATIRAAREAGLEVCSGGIIGMGESMEQRLRLAAECRDSGAVSLPMNLLNPIKGTPLEATPLLPEEEVVRSAALMRLIAPDVVIRFAGGRARLSREATLKMLRGGVNGVMIGDLLTTAGNTPSADMEMIADEVTRSNAEISAQ
ncbi:MAG: biotin synthase BioB [Bacteroidales bacterium]|nr:biotin synthase BioB [Bacteroidales bacterium]